MVNVVRCLVPDCQRLAQRKLTADGVPLCTPHAVKVWQHIATVNGAPAETPPPAEPKRTDQTKPGDIYIARINGLIKIGWSSRLYHRLQSYGPGVDMLCHYPGTMRDEKALHHRFRPFLARGREWFHEHQQITDYVAEMVAQHGPPVIRHEWSTPTTSPVKPRYWRGVA